MITGHWHSVTCTSMYYKTKLDYDLLCGCVGGEGSVYVARLLSGRICDACMPMLESREGGTGGPPWPPHNNAAGLPTPHSVDTGLRNGMCKQSILLTLLQMFIAAVAYCVCVAGWAAGGWGGRPPGQTDTPGVGLGAVIILAPSACPSIRGRILFSG